MIIAQLIINANAPTQAFRILFLLIQAKSTMIGSNLALTFSFSLSIVSIFNIPKRIVSILRVVCVDTTGLEAAMYNCRFIFLTRIIVGPKKLLYVPWSLGLLRFLLESSMPDQIPQFQNRLAVYSIVM